MRVNIRPDVITRDAMIHPAAHVQRFLKRGDKNLIVAAIMRAANAFVAKRPQLKGSLYGIGIGVWFDSWLARGPASNPPEKSYLDGAVLPLAGSRGPSVAGYT